MLDSIDCTLRAANWGGRKIYYVIDHPAKRAYLYSSLYFVLLFFRLVYPLMPLGL